MEYYSKRNIIISVAVITAAAVLITTMILLIENSPSCELQSLPDVTVNEKLVRSNDDRVLTNFAGYLEYHFATDSARRYMHLSLNQVSYEKTSETTANLKIETNCSTFNLAIRHYPNDKLSLAENMTVSLLPGAGYSTCFAKNTEGIRWKDSLWHYSCDKTLKLGCFVTLDPTGTELRAVATITINRLEIEVGGAVKHRENKFNLPNYCPYSDFSYE